MKKVMLCVSLSVFFMFLLTSQETAVIKVITGKVQIKTAQGLWVSASEGSKVTMGTEISTGLRSWAVIDLGSSELYMKQLTRMRLDKLVQKEGLSTTQLYLRTGKVNAKVKTAAGLKHDFLLKSSVSTAAVRGTEFDYDTVTVYVSEGVVELANNILQIRRVIPGETSHTSGYDPPASGEEGKNEKFKTDPYTGNGGKPGGIKGEKDGSDFSGTITIVF